MAAAVAAAFVPGTTIDEIVEAVARVWPRTARARAIADIVDRCARALKTAGAIMPR